MPKLKSGKLRAYIGASRSGKTVRCQEDFKHHDRLLIWDIKGEYNNVKRAKTRKELFALINSHKGKPGKIAFTCAENIGLDMAFDYFCRMAQVWVKLNYLAGKNCGLIFEETADVTSPGKAPSSYGIILRRFLALGVDIAAITQRPAESDKTAVGNASIVHLCRLQIDRDRKAAANDTGVPLEVVKNLRADQEKSRFDFVEVDTGKGFYRGGVLTFTRNKPVFTHEKEQKPI